MKKKEERECGRRKRKRNKEWWIAEPTPLLTLLFLLDASGSVIQAPNLVPDVLMVVGPVIFISFPHAVNKRRMQEIKTVIFCGFKKKKSYLFIWWLPPPGMDRIDHHREMCHACSKPVSLERYYYHNTATTATCRHWWLHHYCKTNGKAIIIHWHQLYGIPIALILSCISRVQKKNLHTDSIYCRPMHDSGAL